MSTWAERLSSRRTSQQSTPVIAPSPAPPGTAGALSPLAADGPTFTNGSLRKGNSAVALELHASPSAWSVSAHTGPGGVSPSPEPDGARGQTLSEIREEFRQQAEARNRDPMEVPFIHIPLDCWEWVTACLHYADVLHLASTCRRLWVLLRYRDSLWEQQLRFFHEEMQAMRGGALLPSQFAIPPHATMPGYEWFLRERQLYVRDARREWHFKEFTQLDDRETGSFTVAIHDGAEATQSVASAPLSRPRADEDADGVHVPQASGGVAPGHRTAPTGRRVGEPLMLHNVPPLILTVQRPLRQGEKAEDFAWHAGERSDDENSAEARSSEEAAETTSVTQLSQGPEEYWRLQESTGLTEEELLQYVLAVSRAETRAEVTTPQPPSSADVVSSPRPPWRPLHIPTLAVALKPSELMTVVDFMNHGSVENSRTRVLNITDLFNAQCGPAYATAVAETLRSVMRRRLHFESHHRALLNNGETRRHRLGRLVAPAGTGGDVSGEASSATTATTATQPTRPLQASDIPGGYPVNRMFRHFTGKLLEISRQEANLIATQLLRKPELVDDFCVFPLPPAPTLPLLRKPLMAAACDARRQLRAEAEKGGSGIGDGGGEEDVLPAQVSRFFLAPELCVGGRVGLIIIDPVRVLVVVEAERTTSDDPSWSGPQRVERTGRVYTPGQGYNAQYYHTDDAHARFA